MRFCAHELSWSRSLVRIPSLWYVSDKRARTPAPLARHRIGEIWFKCSPTCTVIRHYAIVLREFYSRLDIFLLKSLSLFLIAASYLLFHGLLLFANSLRASCRSLSILEISIVISSKKWKDANIKQFRRYDKSTVKYIRSVRVRHDVMQQITPNETTV